MQSFRLKGDLRMKHDNRLKEILKTREQRAKELRKLLLRKAGITEMTIQMISNAEREYNRKRRLAEEEFRRKLAKIEDERRQQIKSALKISEHNKEFLRLHKEVYTKVLGDHIYDILVNS